VLCCAVLCCAVLCCAVLCCAAQDNFPTLKTVASDLSPFYLAKARENVNYWKSQRAAQLDLGGPEGTGETYVCSARFVVLNL
jgi:hypothetical protein